MAKKPAKSTVTRCVARQDGGYLIITADKKSGVSSSPIAEGCWVKIDSTGKIEVSQ